MQKLKYKELDIGSDVEGIRSAKLLSNFTEFHFIIDGIECASMEGFLQSLKFSDPEKQIAICKLIGGKAKMKGKNKKWYKNQILYWKGASIDRHSIEYQELIDKAYSELFKDDNYKELLRDTKGYTLTHNIGKIDPKQTILTIDEFCQRLMDLRDYCLK